MMSDSYCSDCKRQTEVVFDHSAGDTDCSECGLVLESHYIDETSEWRNFKEDSVYNDSVRVGGPINPLLTDGNLSTLIAKPNGTSGWALLQQSRLKKAQKIFCYSKEMCVPLTDSLVEGCVRLISSPFYSCKDCDFYLHKRCAELPETDKFPFHLHLNQVEEFYRCRKM